MQPAGPFSIGQIFRDVIDCDFAGTFQLMLVKAPFREFRQGATGRKLVIFREPALDRQIPDKGIYLLFHVRYSG